MSSSPPIFFFFFFNDTATTEIYTLSLHDALPIFHILFLHLDGLRQRDERTGELSAAEFHDAIKMFSRPLLRFARSEEHTSELQSPCNLVCRLLLEKKKNIQRHTRRITTHLPYIRS